MGGVCATITVDQTPASYKTEEYRNAVGGPVKRQGAERRNSKPYGSRPNGDVDNQSKRSSKRPKKRRSRSEDPKRENSFSKYSITEASKLAFERDLDFDSQFKRIKKLGRGSFGVVWRIKRLNGEKTYACKEIAKEHCSRRELDLIYLECEMMHLCQHRNICRLIEVYDGRESVCMIMEEMKGGELFDRMVEVQKFTERDCAKQIRCVFQAIAHMHSLGVVHRDLKPENLCYRDLECTRLKVIDLGLSCYIDDCPPEACGTFEFLAPEQMLEKGYEEKIDVFALGIIVHVMMIGKSPFRVPKDEIRAWEELDVWYSKMARTRIKFPDGKLSQSGQRFIRGCLEIDPEKRFSAEEAANHEWLTNTRGEAHTLDATDLKKYQIMTRLKRGVRTLICLKRMAKLLLEENERYERSSRLQVGGSRLHQPERWVRADSWSVSIAHLPLSQRIQAVAHRRESKRSNMTNPIVREMKSPPPDSLGGDEFQYVGSKGNPASPYSSRTIHSVPTPNTQKRNSRIVHV